MIHVPAEAAKSIKNVVEEKAKVYRENVEFKNPIMDKWKNRNGWKIVG